MHSIWFQVYSSVWPLDWALIGTTTLVRVDLEAVLHIFQRSRILTIRWSSIIPGKLVVGRVWLLSRDVVGVIFLNFGTIFMILFLKIFEIFSRLFFTIIGYLQGNNILFLKFDKIHILMSETLRFKGVNRFWIFVIYRKHKILCEKRVVSIKSLDKKMLKCRTQWKLMSFRKNSYKYDSFIPCFCFKSWISGLLIVFWHS